MSTGQPFYCLYTAGKMFIWEDRKHDDRAALTALVHMDEGKSGKLFRGPTGVDKMQFVRNLKKKSAPVATNEPMEMTRCACGSADNVTFAPDPYAEEIKGDDKPVYMCDDCRDESRDKI